MTQCVAVSRDFADLGSLDCRQSGVNAVRSIFSLRSATCLVGAAMLARASGGSTLLTARSLVASSRAKIGDVCVAILGVDMIKSQCPRESPPPARRGKIKRSQRSWRS